VREIAQQVLATGVRCGRSSAGRTCDTRRHGLDQQLELTTDIAGREDAKTGQTEHDLADIGRAGTVNFHWGLPDPLASSLRILRSQYLFSQHQRSTACRR
jgi:hypothetical protein